MLVREWLWIRTVKPSSVRLLVVKGTTNGIITDIDGKFTLNDVPEAGVIQISYIGYKTQEISAKNKANLKVVLVEDNEMLDEVVVVAMVFRRNRTLPVP